MKDNFSRQASVYAKYRPDYPPELFEFILSHISNKKTAWDCATGNGQTAKVLAKHFEEVYATDFSQKQLDQAEKTANIHYSLQPAEKTNFPDNSFDLITVSQALHWFQFDQFYAEVRRVAKPGSWIAVWSYSLLNVSPAIDSLINAGFYTNVLGKFWDYERRHVDNNYRSVPFPFQEIECPTFTLRFEWSIDDLEGYLNSWSALQKFIAANQYNPVDELIKEIQPLWVGERMEITFPLTLRMGKI